MSDLDSKFDILNGWPAGSALGANYPVASGTLVEGDVVKISSGAPVGTATGQTLLDPAVAPAADIDVFIDPNAAADFVTAAITDDHLLDLCRNANADMITLGAAEHIFDDAYAGAKTLRGLIGAKRLRSTSASAFTTARTAQALTYMVRPAVLKSEDAASAYLIEDVDAIAWANTSAIFDTFTDPAAGVDLAGAGVVLTDLFDSAHNATADLVTLAANEHYFSDAYVGAKGLHATEPVLSDRRLRMVAGSAFAGAHAANPLTWLVRAPILKAEDPASPYLVADADAIVTADNGGGFTRITKAGEFATAIVGDVAKISGGAVAGNNGGWMIIAVDVGTDYIDVNLAYAADGNSGLAGFEVQCYHPDFTTAVTPATVQVAQTITAAGAGGFAGVSAGDIACVLVSTGSAANVGLWRVASVDVTDTILSITAPAGYALIDELGGATDVAIFTPKESNVATAATVGDRGLTRITKAGQFVSTLAGDVAKVSGGDTAGNNGGWLVHAVDGGTNYIDVVLPYAADANTGVSGFQVQTYHPDTFIAAATAALGTQKITKTAGCAAAAIGDIAMILGTANKGSWYISAKTADDITVEAPAGHSLADEATGLTYVAIFTPVASRGNASVTVRKRLTRLYDTGATFLEDRVLPGTDEILMPWPASSDPLHWDTTTVRWDIDEVVDDYTIDADLGDLEELAPEDFIAGYAANAPYRLDVHLDKAVVSKLTSADAQHTDGSLNQPDRPWVVIQGNDQADGEASKTVAALACGGSGSILKLQNNNANTLVPGDLLYSNAGVLTEVTRTPGAIGGGAFYSDHKQPVAMVLESNATAGANGEIVVVTV